MIRKVCVSFLLAVAAGTATAQDLSGPAAQSFLPAQSNDPAYQKGVAALDAHDWDNAITQFDVAAAHKGSDADAALYWKAYAQSHAGRAEDALGTIAKLRRQYPSSRWLHDAQAIEVELRGQSGDSEQITSQPDQELKLMALNSLMMSDANTAVPILVRILHSNDSNALKDRALFILTQNSSPEARKAISDVARDSQNRALQLRAIRYTGMMGNDESRKELASLYTSSSDEAIKREILKGYMLSGSRSLLLSVAKSEHDPALRQEAIRNLALTGGQAELASLYSTDASVEERKDILRSMFLTGNSSKLLEVARTDSNPELRAAAIKSLGLMGNNGSGDDLVKIYESDTHSEVRNAILQALFLQQNGKALVDLARAEKDPAGKQAIVQKMALVHSKDTTDYMMELLK